jgi:hypothetical protein
MIGLLFVQISAQALTEWPQIEISRPKSFACEAEDSASARVAFSGEFVKWTKHDHNDSGIIRIASASASVPSGDFIAIAQGNDISSSNYFTVTDQPTKLRLVVGDDGHAVVSVEVKSSGITRLFAGFCKGDFAGIGAVN